MDTKLIKYIGFDLDNTLIDRDFAFKSSVKALLKQEVQFNETLLRSILKKDNSGLIPRENLYEWMIQTIPLKGWDLKTLFHFFAENMGNYLIPKKEITDFLRDLSRKYGLYLITNGSAENQRNKIAHSGFASIFTDHIFISGELGFAKPQREIFEFALNKLGISSYETVFVGDNPETDIQGANNCGIFSILLRRAYNKNEKNYLPGMILNDIRELKNVFHG